MDSKFFFIHLGSSRKLGSTCKKTAPNIEVFGKILPEKEPKLPKKAVFGHFFLVPIEQKIPYVRYFFRITLNLPYVRYFFSNYVEFPSKYRTFGIFS